MDVVLGLSMTSTGVRWVLVEGSTGEGAPIDRGSVFVDATFDADALLDVLLGCEAAADYQVHAVGVTWAREAEATANAVLAALAAKGMDGVVAISEVEAAYALARGIADIAGYEDVAVCVVEPEAAVVALVDAGGVTVERIDRSELGPDEVTGAVAAIWEPSVYQPEAIFVLGSGDLDPIVSEFTAASQVPVVSAAEADMALARGTALASATAVDTLAVRAGPVGLLGNSTTGALTSLLVAAVVTFVVSVSAAVGLQAVPDEPAQRYVVDAADLAPAAPSPSVAHAAPVTPPAVPPQAPPRVAATIALIAPPESVPEPPAAAPVEPAPEYQAPAPEPVYVPPAPEPAYVPPAPPVYAPPPVAPPQPRLRDRIIEKIPIVGRFHEPKYPG